MAYETISELFEGICGAIRGGGGTADLIPHQKIPERIRAISAGWRPPSDWWDVESIVQNDVQGTYEYKVIELLADGDAASSFTGGAAYKTSDGQFYNAPTAAHTWDTARDLPCSEGYKTRWVIKYYETENISLTVENSCKYFVIDKAKFDNSGLGNSTAALAKKSLVSFKLINGADLQASVNSTNSMFRGCLSLKSIPLFDTSNVTHMQSMCLNCFSLASFPPLDTSNVVNMTNMFYGCHALRSIPPPDTSNVTNMTNMFYYCYSLTALPPLDSSKVTAMSDMFYACCSLTALTLDMPAVSAAQTMLYNCYSLTSAKLRGINTDITLSTAAYGLNISRESIMYIIRNRSGTGIITVTLGEELLGKLSEDDIAEATAKNITLA